MLRWRCQNDPWSCAQSERNTKERGRYYVGICSKLCLYLWQEKARGKRTGDESRANGADQGICKTLSSKGQRQMNLVERPLNQDTQGLIWDFHVSPTSCNNPDYYSTFLRFTAVSDFIEGMGVTHLLIDEQGTGNVIAGYITLKATALLLSGENGTYLGRPAVEIAELAVREGYERKGVGSALIDIAISKIDEIRRHVLGIRCMVVCADPSAVGFYEKYGFYLVSDLYEVLRDGSNNNCVAMMLPLVEN